MIGRRCFFQGEYKASSLPSASGENVDDRRGRSFQVWLLFVYTGHDRHDSEVECAPDHSQWKSSSLHEGNLTSSGVHALTFRPFLDPPYLLDDDLLVTLSVSDAVRRRIAGGVRRSAVVITSTLSCAQVFQYWGLAEMQ